MKTMKRLLAVTLCLVMLLGVAGGLLPAASAVEYKAGDIVEFGRYPQTRETNTTIINNLNKACNENMWKNCGYYSGTATDDDYTDTTPKNDDYSYFGKMTDKTIMQYAQLAGYIGIRIKSLRPYNTVLKDGLTQWSNQDENGYAQGNVYWFKIEPLKWRVLNEEGMMICTSVIDSQPFNEIVYGADTWYSEDGAYNPGFWTNSGHSDAYVATNFINSTLRTWLNNFFYNLAFNDTEKAKLSTSVHYYTTNYTVNKNEVFWLDYSNSAYDSRSFLRSDKVVLPTYDEISQLGTQSRYGVPTDYAKCQGLYMQGSYGRYWLCNGYDNPKRGTVKLVQANGNISGGDAMTLAWSTSVGIRPVVQMKTFYLSYSVNVVSGAVAKTKQWGNGEITLDPPAAEKLYNPGYELIGWSTTQNATTAQYQAGDTFDLTTDTYMYPVWKKQTVYTLTYDANGGSDAPAAQTDAKSVIIPQQEPTWAGHKFLYWNKKADGSDTTKYKAGWTYEFNGVNGKLYAIWETIQYTLTYNANGGTGAPAAQVGTTSVKISTQKPTLANNTFKGWNVKQDGSGKMYQANDDYYFNGANGTLFAIWEKTPVTPSNPTSAAALSVGAGRTVDYKTTVTVVARATGVPAGYFVAIYDGNTQLAKGDNTTAQYTADKMTAGKTFTAKVVDANGAVQKDGSGGDLAKNVEVGVKTGFFAKLAAFFRTIFGLLPKITIQP